MVGFKAPVLSRRGSPLGVLIARGNGGSRSEDDGLRESFLHIALLALVAHAVEEWRGCEVSVVDRVERLRRWSRGDRSGIEWGIEGQEGKESESFKSSLKLPMARWCL